MLTTSQFQELEDRVRKVTCQECLVDGRCSLNPSGECLVAKHLPGLVEVVQKVDSDRMDDYVQKVREEVCTVCRSGEQPQGGCDYRAEGRCNLDALMLPIVTITEDYLSKLAETQRQS